MASSRLGRVAIILAIGGFTLWAWGTDYQHAYASPSGYWLETDAWSPAGIPGADDTANVHYGISLTDSAKLSHSVDIGTLNLDTYISWGPAPSIDPYGGTLNILDGGTWQWGGFSDYYRNAGIINQYGTLQLVDDISDHRNDGPETVDDIAHEIQWGMTLNNYGVMLHTGKGTLSLGANACQYVNYGTHNFTSNGNITTVGHGGERTTNHGLIVKSGGAGVSFINGETINLGTIEAQTGTLTINNSLDYESYATHTLLGGKWVVQDNASIIISGRGVLKTIAPDAHVVLNGANANLYTTQTSTHTPLEANLQTIAGTLELHGDRTFSQPVTNTGSLVIGDNTTLTMSLASSGLVQVGNSPGHAVINGDLTQLDTSVLEIELGGLLAGDEYDLLEVAGMATLSGTLDVTYWDSFAAQVGDTFTIIEAGTLSGTFDQVTYPDGQVWDIAYDTLAGEVTLTLLDVPEPTTWIMLLACGLLFGLLRRH